MRLVAQAAKRKLQNVVQQEVVPIIRLERRVEGNGQEWYQREKKAELKALKKQSRSVLVRDRFAVAKTIYHTPGKQLVPKPTGRLLHSLERLAQPRRGGGWEEEQDVEEDALNGKAGAHALPQQREDMMKASMKTRQKMELATPDVSVLADTESNVDDFEEEVDDGRDVLLLRDGDDEEQNEHGHGHELENQDEGQCDGGDKDKEELKGAPGESKREAVGAGTDLESLSEPAADLVQAPHVDDAVTEEKTGDQPDVSIVGPAVRGEFYLAEQDATEGASARSEDLEAEAELLARRKSEIAEEVALLCSNRFYPPDRKQLTALPCDIRCAVAALREFLA